MQRIVAFARDMRILCLRLARVERSAMALWELRLSDYEVMGTEILAATSRVCKLRRDMVDPVPLSGRSMADRTSQGTKPGDFFYPITCHRTGIKTENIVDRFNMNGLDALPVSCLFSIPCTYPTFVP